MAHRWWMKIFGSMSALSLVVVGSAWALPTHEYDMGWGKGGSMTRTSTPTRSMTTSTAMRVTTRSTTGDGKLSSHHKAGWDDLDKHWWGKLQKHKDYDGHEFVKWGKGYWKDDPDCDPPVSSPEPGTLLLLGSTLAGVGVYARRRRQPAGG